MKICWIGIRYYPLNLMQAGQFVEIPENFLIGGETIMVSRTPPLPCFARDFVVRSHASAASVSLLQLTSDIQNKNYRLRVKDY